jgi:hypothetical protein
LCRRYIYFAGQLIANPESDANYGVTSYISVRSIAVSLIGDILIEIGAAVNDQYREQTGIALHHAHEHLKKLFSQLAQLEDEDISYADTLINDVLTLWSSLSQAHKLAEEAQPGAGHVFTQMLPHALECLTLADTFTQWLAADQSRGDADPTLRSCANLVIDIAKCLGPGVAVQLRTTPVVTNVLQVCCSSSPQPSPLCTTAKPYMTRDSSSAALVKKPRRREQGHLQVRPSPSQPLPPSTLH